MRAVFCLLLAILFAACERQAASNAQSGAPGNPLRVGMEMKYPPFEMRDTQGQPAGISVDLARALGAALGRPVEFSDLPFAGLIPALKTGQIDVVISSMTATEERRQSVDFSDPYLRTGLCLLVGKTTDVQSAADLDRPNRRVAVVKATTGHLWASTNLKQATVLVLGEESAAALEVHQGKADAFIYDQMSTLRNSLRYADTTRPLLQPFKEEGWAVALSKGNDALRNQVNDFLRKFKSDGGFDRLGDQWLAEQKREFQRLGVPFVF
jgi:polar amino acid transport system substrate-binding protein